MTDKIKKKIQELVPDVMSRNISVIIPAPFKGLINYRDDRITLAVVLRAIKKSKKISAKKWFEAVDHLVGRAQWNLELDSWDDQTKETQQFIGQLLGVQ